MLTTYILAVFASVLYLKAFFPINPYTATKHELPNKLQDIDLDMKKLYGSSVNKTVLVVIDALRHDFITEENTPNTMKIMQADGCIATVKVESPTVTLPRIKALTTGSVPQFIDVILNLLDTESATDSFIHQARLKGNKVVFYGDDTWLKLYPNIFMRSEGTSSFYVYDYTEVDNNVTRNVHEELLRSDWDVMILHYLGLDHIGHIAGPFSHLTQPKLHEMDSIIKQIYDAVKTTDGVIIVTGDHGMKDSGGHGGTTYSETRVPLLLLGRQCIKDEITQSDIPAIISALMGLPFPSSSIGKISTKLLSSIPIQKMLYSLRYNALFLANKTDLCRKKLDLADEIYHQFLQSDNRLTGDYAARLYEECLEAMNVQLLHSFIRQEEINLILCLSVLTFCLVRVVLGMLNYDVGKWKDVVILIILIICYSFNQIGYFKYFFTLVGMGFIIHDLLPLRNRSFNTKITATFAVVVLNIVYAMSMGATSFIEEEHQTWYFFFTTILIIIFITKRTIWTILALYCFRFLKKLNQTGDKWAAEPDITQWLLMDEHDMFYHIFYAIALISIAAFSLKLFCKNRLNKIISVSILTLIYIFKIHTENHIILAQFIWFLIFVNLILTIFQFSTNSLINAWIMVICLLCRPQNAILIPFCIFITIIISQQSDSIFMLSILHLWFGNVLYFCQGHSNSISSIDIAAGYIGLHDYKPFYISLQILANTYSLPILTNLLLLSKRSDFSIWNAFISFRILITVVTYTIAYLQRHHLFIWSVFAPKILLEFGHSLILLLQMLLHYGIVSVRDFMNKRPNF